jgi:hypothetical protein
MKDPAFGEMLNDPSKTQAALSKISQDQEWVRQQAANFRERQTKV